MSFLLRFAASLPLPLLHVLGAMLGWMIYAASPRYRRHLQANLAQAGYTDATLRRAAIAAAGRGVLELPALWLRPHAGVAALVREVSGWELVAAAHARGKGILFLTPHLGCFEITAQYYASRAGADAPLTVLYTPPKKKVIEPAMLAGRDRPGLRIAAPDLSGVRAMLRALKNGEAVGILPDQAPGVGQGEWTEFFGKPAYTMTLVDRLQRSGDASVILAYAERLPGGRGYALHLAAMPEAVAGEHPVRQLNRAIEGLVRRCPAQYYWGYNRYKVPAGAEPQQGTPANA
jgi:KDO2-lipid IV(A) lauroyltransferase